MILDENLFEAEIRGVKAGTKRQPYNTQKKSRRSKFTKDSVYGDLDKLGYNLYADNNGLQIGKFKESSLTKAKDYLDSKNIPYTVKYEGYPKKYWLHIDLRGLDENLKENVYNTQDITGKEMSFDIKDDGTLTIYSGDKEIRKTKTYPEYARKVFRDLGFKEMVKEGWKDIAKSDKQSFESIMSKEEFDKLVSSDKTNHLTINNYNITWYPEHGLVIRKIVDGKARPFADMIDKELVLKGYETVKKEYDSQINYPNSHLNTPKDIDESVEYDETQPPKGTKYYIKVKTDDKGGIGASYVYGKIKEFPDGTKIGIHKTPYDEIVATDIRTGMRIIGTHSPIYQGGDLVKPKRKQNELFDQAYELLKSINKGHYNSIPNIKTLVGEEEVNESKNSSLKGKFESQKGFFNESLVVEEEQSLEKNNKYASLSDRKPYKVFVPGDHVRYINNDGWTDGGKADIGRTGVILDSNYVGGVEIFNIKADDYRETHGYADDSFLAHSNNLEFVESLKEELSPEQEKEYGLTTMINSLIKDELEAIDGYNSAIVTLEAENKGEFTDIIRDIISEENTHVGQLQAILKELNPQTTEDIKDGQEEGQEQIDKALGVAEDETEETRTTIDTESGEIKTFKLDTVEKVDESLAPNITFDKASDLYDKYIDYMSILQGN